YSVDGSTAPLVFDEVGSTTLTLTVTDVEDRTASCTATVTVQDVMAPTITCPPTVYASTAPNATSATVELGTPTGADNSGGDLEFVRTPEATTTFPLGTSFVTWRARDPSDNLSQPCDQAVVVSDGGNLVCAPSVIVDLAVSATLDPADVFVG